MQGVRIVIVTFLVACAFAVAAHAQEFSATGASRDTTGHVVKSKIYMSGGKVRLDPQEIVRANEQTYGIPAWSIADNMTVYSQPDSSIAMPKLTLHNCESGTAFPTVR